MTFEEVKALMRASGTMRVGKGATEAGVTRAERELGVPIQGGYRQFLLELGWGGIAGLVLYGLGDDVPDHLDLVKLTLSERTEMHPRLRHELVPVMNNGGGDLYCLDTTTPGPKVVGWWHEESESQTPTHEAEDFSTWLGAQVREVSAE